jgi:hypothetical protein
LKTLFSGIGFILGNKVLLGAALLDLFAVLLGNATAVLPISRAIFSSSARSVSACCARRRRQAPS